MTSPATAIGRLGLVVHPTRDVDGPLRLVREWARAHDIELAQVACVATRPGLLDERSAHDCDLIVAIGGDGTTLAAIGAAAAAGRPVLGVACGSLGVLTSVAARDAADALDRFAGGDWTPRRLPALRVRTSTDEELRAFNDLAVVRQGEGQVRVAAYLDGVLFARTAGDGCVVSTPVGSSAYTIAAGGPLLAPRLDAMVLTFLPRHGGFCPPLVVAGSSELELQISAGHAGGRLELDGRERHELPDRLAVSRQQDAATVVAFAGQESHLTGLRRRGIVTDSPRILVDDRRG